MSRTISLAEVLPALSLWLSEGCLFPNLVMLHWSHGAVEFPYIRLFLGPKITQITTPCRTNGLELTLLSILPLKCPALTNVSIFLMPTNSPDELSVVARDSMSSFIQSLPHIRVLHTCLPDAAALEHIATLLTLRSLQLQLPAMSSTWAVPERPIFVNLRNLVLQNAGIEPATRFVELCVCCVEIVRDRFQYMRDDSGDGALARSTGILPPLTLLPYPPLRRQLQELGRG